MNTRRKELATLKCNRESKNCFIKSSFKMQPEIRIFNNKFHNFVSVLQKRHRGLIGVRHV